MYGYLQQRERDYDMVAMVMIAGRRRWWSGRRVQ